MDYEKSALKSGSLKPFLGGGRPDYIPFSGINTRKSWIFGRYVPSTVLPEVALSATVCIPGEHPKPPKFGHIFVAVITFFLLSSVQTVLIQLVLIVWVLR